MQQSTWLMKVQLLCEQDYWESSSPDVQHPGPEQDYWKNSSPVSSKPGALISAAQTSPRKLHVFGPKNLMWQAPRLQDMPDGAQSSCAILRRKRIRGHFSKRALNQLYRSQQAPTESFATPMYSNVSRFKKPLLYWGCVGIMENKMETTI